MKGFITVGVEWPQISEHGESYVTQSDFLLSVFCLGDCQFRTKLYGAACDFMDETMGAHVYLLSADTILPKAKLTHK